MARPIEKDPKTQIRVGIKKSVIDKLGGVEKTTKKAAELVNKEASKIKKV